MGFRGVLLWPVVRVAGWADDNPLRAAGVIVAVGALAAVVASAGLESGGDAAGTAAYDGATAGAVVERPSHSRPTPWWRSWAWSCSPSTTANTAG